jgi:hypothetical protein
MKTVPIKSLLAFAAALLLVLCALVATANNGMDQLNQMAAEGYGLRFSAEPGSRIGPEPRTPGPRSAVRGGWRSETVE